jgi:hypothetical protein
MTLQDNNAAQGLSATQTFTWEARDASYAQTVLSDGPVSYWRMEETSGTAAADVKGANAGTYTGGPTLGKDGLVHDGGKAPRFVSGTNWVSVPSSASLGPTAAISVEAWVRVEGVPPSYRRFAWKGTSAYQIRLDGPTRATGSRSSSRSAGPSSRAPPAPARRRSARSTTSSAPTTAPRSASMSTGSCPARRTGPAPSTPTPTPSRSPAPGTVRSTRSRSTTTPSAPAASRPITPPRPTDLATELRAPGADISREGEEVRVGARRVSA